MVFLDDTHIGKYVFIRDDDLKLKKTFLANQGFNPEKELNVLTENFSKIRYKKEIISTTLFLSIFELEFLQLNLECQNPYSDAMFQFKLKSINSLHSFNHDYVFYALEIFSNLENDSFFFRFEYDLKEDKNITLINLCYRDVNLTDVIGIVRKVLELGYNIDEGFVHVYFNNYLKFDPNKSFIRSIEFSPENFQIGISILNFFGTFLRENYEDQNPKVTIEQHENKVTLTVDTESGEPKVIEKAFNDFSLIVSGTRPASDFIEDQNKILRLENKIDLLKAEYKGLLRSYKIQERDIEAKSMTINNLWSLLLNSEIGGTTIINEFKPYVPIENKVNVELNFKDQLATTLSTLAELKKTLPSKDPTQTDIDELELSAKELNDLNPESVKTNFFSKLGKFILKTNERMDTISKTVEHAKSIKQYLDILREKHAWFITNFNQFSDIFGFPNLGG